MYRDGHKIRGAKKLPLNMLDATRTLQKDKYLCQTLGEEFSAAYIKLRSREWTQFTQHLTEWERQNTLDC